MYHTIVACMIRRLLGQILKLARFLDLHVPRLFPVLIDRELRNNGPQPARQTAPARVIRQLALLVSFGVSSKTVELCPDRARKVLGVLIVRSDLPRRRP